MSKLRIGRYYRNKCFCMDVYRCIDKEKDNYLLRLVSESIKSRKFETCIIYNKQSRLCKRCVGNILCKRTIDLLSIHLEEMPYLKAVLLYGD